jgi:hypothetical protein
MVVMLSGAKHPNKRTEKQNGGALFQSPSEAPPNAIYLIQTLPYGILRNRCSQGDKKVPRVTKSISIDLSYKI